jgi:glycosyltransferase involved in cell wall biosynthesis
MTPLVAEQSRTVAADLGGRRLKVCLAAWAPFVGGAEVAAERLALGLQQDGHEVVVLLGHRGPVLERLEGAGLRCLPAPMLFTDKWHWWRWFLSQRRLRRLLQQERPDVLHSNDLPTHQIMASAARGLPIPRVCHHRFTFGGPALEWFNKYGAERHLFVSRALRDDLCAKSERLARSPGAVVHDGLPLPPERAAADREQARRRLGLPADRLLVTFAGQVIERKGVTDLVRAWPLLGAAAGRAELLVVGDDLQGDGSYRRDVQELARATNCPARFVGFQKNVGEWLLASDVAVVPSHVEPLGNACLEAMAYVLPVVACDTGGIPEMVAHEQTGLLVPPRAPDRLAAALARLLTDDDTRQRFGRAGRRRCEEEFGLEAHVRDVLREYRLAVGDGKRPAVGASTVRS